MGHLTESWRARGARFLFNCFPAYWGTGARLTHLAPDWSEARLELPVSWRTKNYLGTLFGGSMYGAVDPLHVMLLVRRLGPGYVVWDKAAAIRFKKPGRTTLHARVALEDAELAAIRAALEGARAVERVYTVELADAQGVVHAVVEKTVHIRRTDARRAAMKPAEAAPATGRDAPDDL